MTEDEFKPLAAQRRSWRIQRAAWALLGLVLLFALAGGLGEGLLSKVERRSADGSLSVSYERVWRANSPQIIDARILAREPGPISLDLDRQFLERAVLELVIPPPLRSELSPEGQRLWFASHDEGPRLVRLRVSARRIGWIRTRLRGGNGLPLELTIFVLP